MKRSSLKPVRFMAYLHCRIRTRIPIWVRILVPKMGTILTGDLSPDRDLNLSLQCEHLLHSTIYPPSLESESEALSSVHTEFLAKALAMQKLVENFANEWVEFPFLAMPTIANTQCDPYR